MTPDKSYHYFAGGETIYSQLQLDLPETEASPEPFIRIVFEELGLSSRGKIEKQNDSLVFPLAGGVCACVREDGSILIDPRTTLSQSRLNALVEGVFLQVVFGLTGKLVLHASSVFYQGSGLCFAGHPRAGKSTIALYLAACGADVLAEDASILSFSRSEPFLHTSGTRVRARTASHDYFSREFPEKFSWQKHQPDYTVPADRSDEGRYELRQVPDVVTVSCRCSALYVLSSGVCWEAYALAPFEAFRELSSLIKHGELLLHFFPEKMMPLIGKLLTAVEVLSLQRSESFSELIHLTHILDSSSQRQTGTRI